MKKNKKTEILSAESLVSMAKASHQKVMTEATKREAEHKSKIASLTEREKGLKAEIETAKGLLEKMTGEFEILEKEKREAIAAELKESGMSKQDVQDGKISMAQFQSQGLSDEATQKMILDSTSETLEKSSDSIRSKATDIVRLELELYFCQSSIHGLLTQPVRLLRMSYQTLSDMLAFQTEGLAESGHLSQSLKDQAENQLNLIEKEASATSSGYIWANITLKEAFRLRLDPIMPKRLVPMLLERLDEIEPGEETRLTVTYHQVGSAFPGDELEIREEL